MSAIVFGRMPRTSCALILTMPDTLASREELFSVLSDRLDFPSYFGRNWDALLDMLSDLEWLLDDEVRIIHNTVPEALGDAWDTYLEVVADAVARRNEAVGRGFPDRPLLMVALPISERAKILTRLPPGDIGGH